MIFNDFFYYCRNRESLCRHFNDLSGNPPKKYEHVIEMSTAKPIDAGNDDTFHDVTTSDKALVAKNNETDAV